MTVAVNSNISGLGAISQGNSTIVSQNSVPIISLPSGNIVDTIGNFTLGTALPTVYSSCFAYFPPNALFSGSAAGLLYCIMSTTTSGRAYNNPYVPSTGAAPVIPASPTTLTTTVQAWTAQTGVDIHLRRAVITGSSMGNNGGFRARYKIGSASGSAGSKTVKVFFGGSIIQQPPDLASQAGLNTEVELQNRGAPNVNLRTGTLMTVFGNVAMANTTFDTSVNQALDLKVNLALATDYIISEGWTVEVRPF